MANAKYRSIIAFVCLLVSSACSHSNGTAPTAIPDAQAGARTAPASQAAIREMDYDINIPDVAEAQALRQRAYPNGVWMSPRAAQARWDYTRAYGGSPNVYFGEIAPRCQYVLRVGIVVAPLKVAGMDTFTAADWNIAEPGYTYAWVGRFVYTMIATPDMYRYDPSATCS